MINKIITIKSESQGPKAVGGVNPKAEGGAGKRLDHFLVESLLDLSRTKIQKMIETGLVMVNGKKPAKHQFLKENDKIEILDVALPTAEPKPVNKRIKNNSNTNRDIWPGIKIIDDTADYLIIEKPTGLLVHPTEKHETNTLIDWAAEKYPEVAKIGDEPGRAGIVHRLDKDVSGLMVIPKTQDAFEHFKRLFKTRQIEKKYTALAYGQVKSDAGEINFPISRGKGREGLFIASPLGSDIGKPAKTLYWIKEKFKNHTLLEVEILTGRTHQIRVHFKAMGHPLVGDELYGKKLENEKTKKQGLNRIFLHASELSFFDVQGKKKNYSSKLPSELSEFLKKVK